MAIDLTQSFDSAQKRINALVTFNEVSKSEKKLKKSKGNSASKSVDAVATQLNKISEQQKRYQRNTPTSFEELINLISLINGSGLDTVTFLRKKLLEASVKIEPEVRKILSEQAIKALGCSQEQTFKGYSRANLELNPLSTLPVGEGIYVPIQSLDFGNLLKLTPTSKPGSFLYERDEPSVQPGTYRNYDGKKPFPMNKELNLRTNQDNVGKSFKTDFGKYYKGSSGRDLFDYEFVRNNEFGVTQDCYRFALISNETDEQGLNNVSKFLQDYYSTIKLLDSADFGAALVNKISGAINIQSNISSEEITQQSKFTLILQRILGLCFDNRREIDVSGISKIGELDGVDETFFEFTEVDLRNIDLEVSNVQNGVIQLKDCDNILLPVDYETINNQLQEFRNTLSGQTTEEQVSSLEKILDSIYQNPDWKPLLPSNVDARIAINKNILQQIPLALASAVLSPKVLLPIFVLMKVVERNSITTYNSYITEANSIIQSGQTFTGQINNIVNNSIDFLQVFRKFNIEVVSKIGAIYLKTLYLLLKKDILQLITLIIRDIRKSKSNKRLKIIQSVLQILEAVLIISQLVNDYRRCKSLVDNILLLLNLISTASGLTLADIPAPILALRGLLPGTDPNRSTINTIQFLQELGIPTGTLPDGSPNLMLLYNLSSNKGVDQENSENGKTEVTLDARCLGDPTKCIKFVGLNY